VSTVSLPEKLLEMARSAPNSCVGCSRASAISFPSALNVDLNLSAQTLDAYQSRIVTKQLATLARKTSPVSELSLVSWRRARIVPGAHIVAASNTRNSLEHCVTRHGKVYVPNSRQSDAVCYLAVQSTEWC
jgi:hypothetical protein